MYIRLKYESFHSEAPFSPYLHVLILQSCFAFRLLFGWQLFHTVFQMGCSSWDRAVEYISLILFLFFPPFFLFWWSASEEVFHCLTGHPIRSSGVHKDGCFALISYGSDSTFFWYCPIFRAWKALLLFPPSSSSRRTSWLGVSGPLQMWLYVFLRLWERESLPTERGHSEGPPTLSLFNSIMHVLLSFLQRKEEKKLDKSPACCLFCFVVVFASLDKSKLFFFVLFQKVLVLINGVWVRHCHCSYQLTTKGDLSKNMN